MLSYHTIFIHNGCVVDGQAECVSSHIVREEQLGFLDGVRSYNLEVTVCGSNLLNDCWERDREVSIVDS